MKILLFTTASLLASLTGARFPALRTANAGPTAATNADEIAALREQLETQKGKLASQDEEMLRLREQKGGTKTEDIEALKREIAQLREARPADHSDNIEDLKGEFEAFRKHNQEQRAEIEQLRKQAAVPPTPQIASATALLMKGAGVEPENVNWRIRAGLSAEQAVEVAAREKIEADEKD